MDDDEEPSDSRGILTGASEPIDEVRQSNGTGAMLMNESIDRNATRIALRLGRDRNRSLLANLLSDHEVVDFTDTVPPDTELCIVDDRVLSRVGSALSDWKVDQQPTHAPVLLLAESSGPDPWERYAGQLGDRIDAIQPIPASKVAVRAQVESLLETRRYSRQLASERQLVEQIFETSPIAKTVLDTEGNIVRANQRAEDVLGLSESELSGRAFDAPEWNIIDENGDPIPSDELPYSRVMQSGEPVYGYEHGIELPDGERAWLSVSVGPLLDENGDVEYLVSAIEDVTEQVAAERELLRTEQSRSLALKASEAGVWEWDVEADAVTWHESTEDLFGMEPGTFEGTYEAFSDRIHPDDRPELEVTLQRAIERKGTFQREFRIIRDDGEVRWLEGRGMVVTDEVGTAERMLGVDVDITERKVRERLLRRTQRAIEASGHAIHITDPDGIIEYVNPAFEKITGYRREEVIGESMRILYSGEMPEDHYSEMWSTIRSGEIWDEETIKRREGGGTYHVSQTVAPITDDAGALDGFVAIQTDITDHKNRLQQLRVMDRILRHNLRNDMNVIRGYAEIIREEGPDTVSNHGDTIVEYSDHLLDLTDKQREITEILSSEPHPVSIDVVSTIRRTVETVEKEYPAIDVDLDLPEHATALATDGLDRAIEELVNNAITHADRVPEVGIHVSDEADVLEIRIADTGPGIPEMERRVVTGERKMEPLYHGSGLGLWLVSWVIRRSKGTLRFEENEPRGTVAVITLRKPIPR